MAQIIDMKLMRYINLFRKISHVSTTNCFVYNNIIIFAVPRGLISKAIGKDGSNMRKFGEAFGKKVKIIAMPSGKEDIEKFVLDVVSPITFNKIEIKDNDVIINAGRQSKAALIGRGRLREQELGIILKMLFGVGRVRVG